MEIKGTIQEIKEFMKAFEIKETPVRETEMTIMLDGNKILKEVIQDKVDELIKIEQTECESECSIDNFCNKLSCCLEEVFDSYRTATDD